MTDSIINFKQSHCLTPLGINLANMSVNLQSEISAKIKHV